MAAKIGILGEGVATSETTLTLYTVPADKAARVRVLFALEKSSSNTTTRWSLHIGTPSNLITIHHSVAANEDFWSGVLDEATPDPALSFLASVQGMQKKSGGITLDSTTNTGPHFWIAPLPVEYFLSTGDTVRVTIFNDGITDHLVQVMGVEDDA